MTAQLARIQTIDTVRGVAVMGILLMNIVAFGMPEAAYMNPRAYGGAHGFDLAVYLVNFVLFDGKMRGLFSFLFGASMLLVIERAEAKGEDPARVHYARMGWLLVFGLAHLWLVWWGDILTLYAPVGMIAYVFRDVEPRRLLVMGGFMLLFQFLLFTMFPATGWAIDHLPGAATNANFENIRNAMGIPSGGYIADQLAQHRAGYATVLGERFKATLVAPVTNLILVGAETLAYMLFGMAALRTGLLTGEWPAARYRRWALIGFGIGIAGYAALAAWLVAHQFSLFAVTIAVMWLPVLLRPPMITAWACLIVLLARPGGALTARIAAAGRMAFSNYILTSLICTTLFYGYGLGWYGRLSRAELYLVVLGVWALILLWSKPWLARFRYGPFEWLWRSLARASPQPMLGPAAA